MYINIVGLKNLKASTAILSETANPCSTPNSHPSPSTHHLSPTTHHPSPTTRYPSLNTHHPPLITHHPPPTTHHYILTTHHPTHTTNPSFQSQPWTALMPHPHPLHPSIVPTTPSSPHAHPTALPQSSITGSCSRLLQRAGGPGGPWRSPYSQTSGALRRRPAGRRADRV